MCKLKKGRKQNFFAKKKNTQTFARTNRKKKTFERVKNAIFGHLC